jgi:hypothetical protein
MKEQNYNNHTRYYTPHHFLFYPAILAGSVISAIAMVKHTDQMYLWMAIIALFSLVGILSFMMRQHYALMNQDRIVRLELRLRYYILTGKRLEEIENKISKGRLFALRFAGDDEFLPLLSRIINENLSADEVKKAIKNWQPDEWRV